MTTDPRAHSRALVDGADRAAARAYFKAVGFTDADLAKPLVGVAHCWIEITPCNWNHRTLAMKVKEGIRAAGGTPIEFNSITVTDGIAMGTEGMKASLVSREVIADSVELVARGHLLDAFVGISGCEVQPDVTPFVARHPTRTAQHLAVCLGSIDPAPSYSLHGA